MDDKRIYSDKVNINDNHVKKFYNTRALKYKEGLKTEYTTVLLGDDNPEYAEKWDEFEKEHILPLLKVSSEANVLDIGCGIGRWAKKLIPVVKNYVGTDFSSMMIDSAKERFSYCDNCHFVNCAFQDIISKEAVMANQYDAIIIAGVSMYINDEDLKKCYGYLPMLLKEGGRLYIEESVGVKHRLTLNHIWSQSLDDDYDAIYRTREEYLELMKVIIDNNELVCEDYFKQLDKEELSETSHWYVIVEKREIASGR